MDSGIVAAIITAIGTIIVALINKCLGESKTHPEQSRTTPSKKNPTSSVPDIHGQKTSFKFTNWIIGVGLTLTIALIIYAKACSRATEDTNDEPIPADNIEVAPVDNLTH